MPSHLQFLFPTMQASVLFALIAAICAILYGLISIKWIRKQPSGNPQMQAIAIAIQQGAGTYLSRQYKVITLVGMFLLTIIIFFIDWETAGGFVIGATFSALAGIMGMNISVRANVRTAQAAYEGTGKAFLIAIRGGSITGMLVVGLGLLAASGYYGVLKQIGAADPPCIR